MTYVLLFLFLFKRKTAYEMRSSDWSSDVCSSDLWVMFYNTALFEQNGVDVPATWSELNQVAETLKANGVTPYYQTSTLFTFQWFQHLVASTDPELYEGLSTGEVKYTDPEIVDIMELWLEQQEAGWFSDPGRSTAPAVGLRQGAYASLHFGTFFHGHPPGAGSEAGYYG